MRLFNTMSYQGHKIQLIFSWCINNQKLTVKNILFCQQTILISQKLIYDLN